MPALAERVHKPPLVVLHDVDGQEFADPEPGAQKGRDERIVPQPFGRREQRYLCSRQPIYDLTESN
jgi:hypothetical protein